MKAPKELADEAKDLVVELLKKRSETETTLLLLGATMTILVKQGVALEQTIDEIGREFAAEYVSESAGDRGRKTCRSKS